MIEFIEKYYIDPIKFGTGYNIVNSTTYAFLFIGTIYLIFLFLKKNKIQIDRKFVIAVIPFAILGSLFRVLEDTNLIRSYFLVTPVIWIIFVFGTFFLLLICRLVEKKNKFPYYKSMFLISLFLLIYPISVLHFKNFYGAFLSIIFIFPWIIIFCLLKWKIENKLVVLAHILDATVSCIAINLFNFFEQYPIPRFLNSINPIVYILTKVVTVSTILILTDKISEDKEFNNYFKLVIAILGISPGLRNLFSLIALS